jgi:hypothetical protein
MNGMKIIILCIINLSIFKTSADANFINELPCSEHKNCSIGVYATSPENQIGTKIIYAEIDDGKRSGEIIVYDTVSQKITDKVKVHRLDPHNAANQYWNDNDVFIYQDGYQDIYGYDVNLQKKIFHLNGKLGIKNQPGEVYIKKDKNNRKSESPGIYRFNISERSETLIVLYSEIESEICKHKTKCRLNDIWNIKYNDISDELLFRVDYEVNGQILKEILMLNTKLFKLKRSELLIHFFIQERSVMGALNEEFITLDENNNLIDVKKIKVNHFDINKGVIATDSWYESYTVFLKLCKLETELCNTVFENNHSNIVWDRFYHVNPSFNSKGNKLFFNYPNGPNSVVAAYVDI